MDRSAVSEGDEENKIMKWNIGEPGGPSGPFWSVVAQNGHIIAMQIPDEINAHLIASLGDIIDCDFNTVHKAGDRLRQILERDISNNGSSEAQQLPIAAGVEDYIIRAVIEALFSGKIKHTLTCP